MQVKVINRIEDLLIIKNEWNELYTKGDYSTFQSFDFNYFSWKYGLISNKGNKLAITVIRAKKGIVAIFPFYIDSNKQLRFINDIHADFCDCISLQRIDIKKVFQAINKQYQIQNIQLINLKSDSIIKTFYEDIKDDFLVLEPYEKYSELQLKKGDFPENYSKYKSKQKTEFRRIKKINKDKIHSLFSILSSTFPKKNIISLKEKMIALGYRGNNFLSDEQLMIIENLYLEKKLLISMIKKNNKVHALSFILKKSNEYLFWIDMFDDAKMVNIFNYISLMQELSRKNTVKMNLGRGTYNYKITNFKPEIKQLFSVFIFSSKFQKLSFLFFKNVMNIIKIIYKKIKR